MAALVATVAVCACTAVRLDAVVYDDFESATRTATLWSNMVWYGTGGYLVTNGQARVFATPDTPGYGAFSFLVSRRTWTVQEGRTLEFRIDLLGSSGDGALAVFGFFSELAGAGYNFALDQDTLAVWKHPSPLSCFFFTNNTPVKVSNVKLVLSMTGTNSSVLLKFKVLDNDNAGAVLFEGEYLDTPAEDTMQRGTDDPPESYLGQSGLLQAYVFRDPGYFDPDVTLPPNAQAEVVFDNAEVVETFEYSPPHLAISPATNGVDLSWLSPPEEHIVVAADQLAGPWRPCWKPHSQSNDVCCLNLPCQSAQQFFRLTPGRQFTDDFSTLVPSWRPWFQSAGEEWIVTNGVLQVSFNQPAIPGLALCPLGATNVEAILGDFCASVDVLSWVTSTTNSITVALFARGQIYTENWGDGYFGGIGLNYNGIPGRVTPWTYHDGSEARGFAFDVAAFPPPYRLQLSGVGDRLKFQVWSLTTGELIREMNYGSSTFANGIVGLWFTGRAEAGDSFTITLDNFFMSGTKP